MGWMGARPPTGFTVVVPETGAGATGRKGAGGSNRSDAGTTEPGARALARGSCTRRLTAGAGARGDGVLAARSPRAAAMGSARLQRVHRVRTKTSIGPGRTRVKLRAGGIKLPKASAFVRLPRDSASSPAAGNGTTRFDWEVSLLRSGAAP